MQRNEVDGEVGIEENGLCKFGRMHTESSGCEVYLGSMDMKETKKDVRVRLGGVLEVFIMCDSKLSLIMGEIVFVTEQRISNTHVSKYA